MTGVTVVERSAAGWVKLYEKLDTGDLHTIAEDVDGTVWFGSYSRGIWRLVPPANGSWGDECLTQFHHGAGLPEGLCVDSGLFDA